MATSNNVVKGTSDEVLDEYPMLHEDEDDEDVSDVDEFPMNEEDDYDDTDEQLDHTSGAEPEYEIEVNLSTLANFYLDLERSEGIPFKSIRHTYFDKDLKNLVKLEGLDYDSLILSLDKEEDKPYLDLLSGMYNFKLEHIEPYFDTTNRQKLIDLLMVVSKPIFDKVIEKSEGKITGSLASHLPLEAEDEDIEGNEEDIDMMTVVNVVETIMATYEELYAPCFLNRPEGILTSKGVLTFNKDGSRGIKKNGKSFTPGIYAQINARFGGYLGTEYEEKTIGSHCFSNDKLVKAYMPLYHLYNINGIKSDGTKVDSWADFKHYLEGDVTLKVKKVLQKIPDDSILSIQTDLIALFTNCIIIENFDISKSLGITYRIGNDNYKRMDSLFKDTEALNLMFAKSLGEIISCAYGEFKVGKLFYVFDKNAYAKEILFAYKAYENMIRSGVKPSISRVVVGKKLDGTDYVVNLAQDTIKLIGIQGASRSGKGVLTLNILATIFGEGHPALYLDFKPDMAVALWDMEQKFNAMGYNAKLYSVDGKDGFSGNKRSPRYFPFGRGTPEGFPLSRNSFNIVPYLKSLQLFCAAVQLRARKQEGYGTTKRIFVIMDEAQGFSREFLPLMNTMRGISVLEEKARGKGSTEQTEHEAYANRFTKIFDLDLPKELNNVRDVTGGTGNAAMLIIGQKVKPDEWSVEVEEPGKGTKVTVPYNKSFMYKLLVQTNLKFIGKNAGTGTEYGVSKLSIPGSSYVNDEKIMGYWVATSDPKPTPDTSTIFKSYLTLNDNDFTPERYQNKDFDAMKYTSGILKSLSESDKQRVIKEELLDGNQVRDSVGFSGLMRMIAGGDDKSLAENMSAGYNLIDKLFRDSGLSERYSCLEEYVHDCSLDSLFTVQEISDAVSRGGSIFSNGAGGESGDLMGDGTGVGPSWENDTLPNADFSSPIIAPVVGGVEAPAAETRGIPKIFSPNSDDLNEADVEDLNEGSSDGSAFDTPDTVPAFGGQQEPESWDNQFDEPDGMPEDGNTFAGGLDTNANEDFDLPPIREVSQPNSETPINVHESNGHIETPVNEQINHPNVYSEPIQLDHSVLQNIDNKGDFSAVAALNNVSAQLVGWIGNMVGTLDRVQQFEIGSSGIRINGYAFRPKLSPEFIQALPFDLKAQVARGNLSELFNFRDLKKFPNLEVLGIDDTRLAEGRAINELGLPNKDPWYKLLQKRSILRLVVINGSEIYDKESSDLYEYGPPKQGEQITQKMSEAYDKKPFNETPLGRIWQTRPAKIAGKALGATAGVKAVGIGIAIFGGWGLLFGAFAGYGAYRKYVKKD